MISFSVDTFADRCSTLALDHFDQPKRSGRQVFPAYFLANAFILGHIEFAAELPKA
jgi:hypothetical protein